MSNATLIIGESGTGKSSSISNLNPKETFVINILDKPLPFRGYKKHYTPIKGWDDKEGNYYATDDHSKIINCIKMINGRRPDIKNLIVDDWQYTMGNEFMRRATENGFAKFTEIGQHAWLTIRALTECREDLYSFVLSHSDTDNQGKMHCKTIGKMLDEKITIEGMFTTVLHSQVIDGRYLFLTQNNGVLLAKSPRGMFKEAYIPNDLCIVKEHMRKYNEDAELIAAGQEDLDEKALLNLSLKSNNSILEGKVNAI